MSTSTTPRSADQIVARARVLGLLGTPSEEVTDALDDALETAYAVGFQAGVLSSQKEDEQ